MNKISYHLILVNSSLRVLTDQVEQLCRCIESSFAEASARNSKVCEKPRIEKQSIINSVYESIKRSRKGIAFTQIQKKTGFSRRQIANAIYKLKERNMIENKKRGSYVKRKCAGDSFQGAVKNRIL